MIRILKWNNIWGLQGNRIIIVNNTKEYSYLRLVTVKKLCTFIITANTKPTPKNLPKCCVPTCMSCYSETLIINLSLISVELFYTRRVYFKRNFYQHLGPDREESGGKLVYIFVVTLNISKSRI